MLGSPVGHSLSPVLHRAAYDELGLWDWTYDAYDVDAAGLAGFLDGLDGSWAGLSLTMPLKAAVLTLLDRSSELVRAVGGANTVLFGPGGRQGENTDVPGMVAALQQLGETTPTVLVRDRGRAAGLEEAAARLGVQPHVEEWSSTSLDAVAGADVVVSTTPAGSTDALAEILPPRLAGMLFDVVYDPWPTPLATAWRERGGGLIGGLDLLVHQAALQVALMTGRQVDVAALVPVLRAAGEHALRTS